MIKLPQSPISRKLNNIIMLTTGLALCIACGAFVLTDISLLRENMARDILVLAKLTGMNSSGALVFEDQVGARAILTKLRAEPYVVSAALYTSDGRLMARYFRDDNFRTPVPGQLPEEHLSFGRNVLAVVHKLNFDGEAIGGIFIAADLKKIDAHLYRLIMIIAIITITTLIFSVLISRRMQKKLLRPILDLTNLVNKVASDKDFSLRAKKTSNDELGTLMDGFNSMLDQINRLAYYDDLTSLTNRHAFKILLDSSLQLVRRQHRRLAVRACKHKR